MEDNSKVTTREGKIIDFIYKHRVLIIVVGIVVFIVLAILVGRAIQNARFVNTPGAAIESVDPISGVTVMSVNEQPEGGNATPTLLGFEAILNAGFTYDQYDVMVVNIRLYFEENYPEVVKVSYDKNSFSQEIVTGGGSLSKFEMVADDGNRFEIETALGTDGVLALEIAPKE